MRHHGVVRAPRVNSSHGASHALKAVAQFVVSVPCFVTSGAAMPNVQTAQAPVLSLRRPNRSHSDIVRPRTQHLIQSRFLGRIASIALAVIGILSASAAQATETSLGEQALATWHVDTKAVRATAAFEVDHSVLPSLNSAVHARYSLERGNAVAGYTTVQHLDITRWLSQDASNRFGLTLGLSAPTALTSTPFNAMVSGTASQPLPQLDLGLRWRSELPRGHYLDVSAWAQAPNVGSQILLIEPPTFGTRVELQWDSAPTRARVPEFGAIGIQLQGGSRLVLRARKGGPMLYYRAKF